MNSRPTRVSWEGWIEHIDVHDRYFLSELRTWKKRLLDAHPDRRMHVYEAPVILIRKAYHDLCSCGGLKSKKRLKCQRCDRQRRVGIGAFIAMQESMQAWLRDEYAWYEHRGLEAPVHKVPFSKTRPATEQVTPQLEAHS